MPPIAIIAGGLATRMRPYTEKIPKALLDVNGKPFILHQLSKLRENGITRVVVCAGYLGGMIEDTLGNGSAVDMKIQYSRDWPDMLGTGGAVKKALPLLGAEFMTIYGDSYLDIDYGSVYGFFKNSHCPALMTVCNNENGTEKSNVCLKDGMVINYDKVNSYPCMKWLDFGLSVFKSDVFADLPDKAFDLGILFQELARKSRLAGYEVHEQYYEIGSPAGLEAFRDKMGKENCANV